MSHERKLYIFLPILINLDLVLWRIIPQFRARKWYHHIEATLRPEFLYKFISKRYCFLDRFQRIPRMTDHEIHVQRRCQPVAEELRAAPCLGLRKTLLG